MWAGQLEVRPRPLGAVTTAAVVVVACVRLVRSTIVGAAQEREREREKGSRPFADQNSLPLLLALLRRRRRRHSRHFVVLHTWCSGSALQHLIRVWGIYGTDFV